MLKQAKAPEAVQRAAQGFSSAMCVGKEVERHQRCLQLFQQSLVRGKWSMLACFGGHLPAKRVKTNRFNIVLVFLFWMNVPISMLRMLIVWIRKRPQEHHG